MSKSGGASRTVKSVAKGVAERRASTPKASKTPEQQHAEKVARAEEAVRKAQARVDAAARAQEDMVARHHAAGRTISGYAAEITEHLRAVKALQSTQTRLATLRAANPSQTPAQRAHAAKSQKYEAQIAKKRDELARLEAEYAAHQRQAPPTTATATPARSRSATTRQQLPPGVPETVSIEQTLRRSMNDVTDPREAWTRFGGSRQSLYDVLKAEPAGVLAAMSRRAGGTQPRQVHSGRYADAITRDRLARHIADQMAKEFSS